MINVIVDEGSSHIKAKIFGENRHVIFPSRVVSKKIQCMNNDASNSIISDHCYCVDGSFYTVHKSANDYHATNSGSEYQTSVTNLVLIHDALRLLGLGDTDVKLTVTLPVNLFFGGDGINHELIKRKKNRILNTEIENFNGHKLAKIRDVVVRPEGFSLAIDALIDDNGEPVSDFVGVENVLVVDIGGTTSDIALLNIDGHIEKFTSSKSAVFPLREKISHRLVHSFELDDDVPQTTMDRVLQTGMLGGCDVSETVKMCAKEQADTIIKTIRALAGNLMAVDLLVVGGGGARLMGEIITSEFSNIKSFIPESPELSVMRGYEKHNLTLTEIEK